MIAFIARQIRRLIALIALAAMLIGAPYALYTLGGPLLPDHMPGLAEIWQRLTERDTGQVFLGFLVIVGFAAWAIFAITVLMEIASRIARRPDWHLPGLHLPQSAAGLLVGMLIAGTIATSATPAIAASMPLLPHPTPVAVATMASPSRAASPAAHHGLAGMTSQAAAPARSHRAPAATGPTWTVSKGDSLWSIAGKTLGSGRRYHEIEALNQGRIQPDGRTLDSANFLLPGWVLQLPAGAHVPPGEGGTLAAGLSADGRGAAETVVVEPGDTLSQIALDELGDAALYPEIAAANHITNTNLIHPGQTIHIPAPSAPARGSTEGAQQVAGTDADVNGVGATTPDQQPDAVAAPNQQAPTAGSQGDADEDDVEHPEISPATARPGAPSTPAAEAPTAPGMSRHAATNVTSAMVRPADIPGTSQAPSARALVFGGATTLTAALAWAGLLTARRRLSRRRQPGERPAAPDIEEAQIERSMRQRSNDAAPQRVDAALRSVTDVMARHAPAGIDWVVIDEDAIELHQVEPGPPPAPFTGVDSVWRLNLPEAGNTDPSAVLSPLPALVTLGTLEDGRVLAVDLEHLGALCVAGDSSRCRNLANHMILELSQSSWADGLHIAVHRVPGDPSVLDSERIRAVEDLHAATQFLRYQVEHTRELLGAETIGQARTDAAYSDAWEPHLLIADSDDLAVIAGIGELIDTLQSEPPAAAGIIALGDRVDIEATITVRPDGTLDAPFLPDGLAVSAASVSAPEFAAVMGLFDSTNVDATGNSSDASMGELATDGTAGEQHDRGAEPGEKTSHTAATLDEDLAEWFSDKLSRPRIAILGDARVDGLGTLRNRPIARMTEYAVYLALHPAGVSIDKFVTDLWPEDRQPSNSTRRAELSRLRAWLGMKAPDEPFLPTVSGRYRITDRLLDAELFAKLRARGMRHEQHGDTHDAMADYQQALSLMRGPILPETAGPGYGWLANPDRMEDRILPTQIVDTAHAVVDIALALGTVADAESAAATGRIADPYSSIPLADMIRISLAQDEPEAAKNWADLLLALNETDRPDDLPEPYRELVSGLYRHRTRPVALKAAS
jgi:LysM repeat protein